MLKSKINARTRHRLLSTWKSTRESNNYLPIKLEVPTLRKWYGQSRGSTNSEQISKPSDFEFSINV